MCFFGDLVSFLICRKAEAEARKKEKEERRAARRAAYEEALAEQEDEEMSSSERIASKEPLERRGKTSCQQPSTR